ncbi:MAG TPA: hypothetical protein VHK91_16485 [Flavisolibacter sp.]|jgi:hypothetical protein|nr:hypothetical protein [Flavisolibacter sp.]
MNTQEEMEVQLWDYIDGSASPEQRSVIERLILEQAAWKAKYQELLEVHQLIGAIDLEQPSMRFTRNVMEEIARYQITPAAKKYIDNKIIWGIGVFFIMMILGFLVYGFSQVNWSAASDSKSSLGIDLNKLDMSQMFNSTFMNGLMVLNVILGLMLFDRYLSNRKKNYMKEA